MIAIFAHFGIHFGAQNCLKIHCFGSHLLDKFFIIFGPLLGQFWGPFSGKNGVKKLTHFLKGSWWLPGAVLGGFLAVLGLSWETGCSNNTVKNNKKTPIFKIASSRYLSYLGGFWRPSWLILGSFGTQNGPQKSKNWSQKVTPIFITFFTSFGIILGSILGQ